MMAQQEQIARLITLESGKALPEAVAEVGYAAEFLRRYSEEALRIAGDLGVAPAGGNRIMVVRQPIGVAVLVTPWNFPAAMATRKIGPALAAGCTVVLKPAKETPLTALAMARIFENAGVPSGVVNVVPTSRSSEMIGTMLRDPRVRKLSFTGSTAVGQHLLQDAASNVIKCSMELGGNAPFVVFADADLDLAVESAIVAKLRNGGESCTAANRFHVEKPVADEFARRLAEGDERGQGRDGLDRDVRLGPMISSSARKAVSDLVDQAMAGGATLLCGGRSLPGKGVFYEPTVLTNVPPSAHIMRQEIFGPVAPVSTFEDEDEAIALANDTELGLVSFVHTRDLARALRVSERIESGMVGINRGVVSIQPLLSADGSRAGSGAKGATTASSSISSRNTSASRGEGESMDVIMPQLGETVREGTVSRWHKRVGETVAADEPLFEVDTDKVTTEVPAPVRGVLAKILIEEGVSVKVGTVLAVIAEASRGEAEPAERPSRQAAVQSDSAEGKNGGVASFGHGKRALPASSTDSPLSPVVRRLLAEHELTVERIDGTGRNGRITRDDVLSYIQSGRTKDSGATSAQAPAPEPAPPLVVARDQPAISREAGSDSYTVPLNRIRKLTAAHMVRSKSTSPHTLQAIEVDFHAVETVRRKLGSQWKQSEGYSLTHLPFIARALCDAIAAFPYVNASFSDDELIVHKRVHLGVAVDLNFQGLMVTVVHDAQHRNVRGIAADINRLSKAVRGGRAASDDLSGATYTISNSGTFGTLFSAPIINQPQAAILSMDAVRKRPVVIEHPEGDSIAIRPVGILAQSFDHRAFDGAYSAAFLHRLKQAIEQRNWAAELS
jgi:succinate-semialdehyde dehydrogenase / glutarate-semialdehyde dehydrogenase